MDNRITMPNAGPTQTKKEDAKEKIKPPTRNYVFSYLNIMKNVSDVSQNTQSRISYPNKRCAKRYITQLFGIISLFVYKASRFSVRPCLKKE